MSRPSAPCLILSLLLLVPLPGNAIAQTVRYFGVWSYNTNAPSDEIPADQLEKRDLGYWALQLDDDGKVVSGTYHGSNGTPWLSFWYESKDGRVYANLYRGPDPKKERHVSRKSTQLSDRMPRLPEAAKE